MKRVISVLLAVVLCFGLVSVVGHGAATKWIERYVEGEYKYLEAVTVFVNRKQVETDAFSMDYRTYVPLRAICEALNCQVDWDPTTLTATISNPLTVVKITRGNPQLALRDRRKPETNGAEPKYVVLDAAPIYARQLTEYSDTLMVPVRAISEALGARVTWNEENYVANITSEYENITEYTNGYAMVNKNNLWGYIDKDGKQVVPVNYTVAQAPDENGIAIVAKNAIWGYVHMEGKSMGSLRFDEVTPFSNGLAAVCKNKKWGYVNNKGDLVINTLYDAAKPYSGEVAAVKKDGKYGFIDKAGKSVGARRYDDMAEGYSNGYAAVCIGGKWGYVDTVGREVIDFKFDYAGPFSEYGTAAVMQNGESFYINTYGNRLYL